MNLPKIRIQAKPQLHGLRAGSGDSVLFSSAMESRQVLYGTDCLFEGVLLVVS